MAPQRPTELSAPMVTQQCELQQKETNKGDSPHPVLMNLKSQHTAPVCASACGLCVQNKVQMWSLSIMPLVSCFCALPYFSSCRAAFDQWIAVLI
jgi:hypothetical protein